MYVEELAAPPVADPAELAEVHSRRLHMARVFLLISGGLLLTAGFALLFARAELTHPRPFGLRLAWNQILFLTEVALVPFIANKVTRVSPALVAALFVAYAVLNGLTFPGLFFWIAPEHVARIFLASAASYGTLAWIYWNTRAELQSPLGLAMLIVVALLPAALVSFGMPRFTRNSCLVIVPIFLAIVLYYDRELAEPYQSFDDDENGWKASLAGAFFLYFAFVNLVLAVQFAIAKFLGNQRAEDD